MPHKKPEPEIEEELVDGTKIKRQGRGVYLVASDSATDKWYHVDLTEHDGLGHCDCDQFLFRLYPRWKNIRKNYHSLRCKHLRRAREHVLDQIIQFYRQEEEKTKPRR